MENEHEWRVRMRMRTRTRTRMRVSVSVNVRMNVREIERFSPKYISCDSVRFKYAQLYQKINGEDLR
jgi:hypothetical protein